MGTKRLLIFSVTPVITAEAYTANDQLGGINVLTDVVADQKSCALLKSLTVIDKSKQNKGIVALFFDALPTVTSVDGQPLDISDSELVSKCIGRVEVSTSDYINVGGASVASITNIDLVLRSNSSLNTAGQLLQGEVWCVLMTTGTPTYTSTSDINLKLGLEQF